MSRPVVATLAALTASLTAAGEAAAEARPPERAVIVLAGVGQSFALGSRRVANQAPPTAELRVAFRPATRPWLVPDLAIGLIVFPEVVPTLGAGVRIHPFTEVPVARHLFARAGVFTLVAVDGPDVALGGEVGAAVTHQRIIGWLGVGADRFTFAPRLVALARVGVGVTF